MTAMGDNFAEHAQTTASQQAKTTQEVSALRQDLDKLKQQYAAMDSTEVPNRRPVANGGSGQQQTDF